jgi:hypothetical protein
MGPWTKGAIVAGVIVGLIIVADLAINWTDYQNAYKLAQLNGGFPAGGA